MYTCGQTLKTIIDHHSPSICLSSISAYCPGMLITTLPYSAPLSPQRPYHVHCKMGSIFKSSSRKDPSKLLSQRRNRGFWSRQGPQNLPMGMWPWPLASFTQLREGTRHGCRAKAEASSGGNLQTQELPLAHPSKGRGQVQGALLAESARLGFMGPSWTR